MNRLFLIDADLRQNPENDQPNRNNSLTNNSMPQVASKLKTDIVSNATIMLGLLSQSLFSLGLFMAVRPL